MMFLHLMIWRKRLPLFFSLDNSFIKRANSSTFSQPAKRPPKTGFIITKAIDDLGYAPVSFDEGIETIAEQAK